jgi:hypothetical protein
MSVDYESPYGATHEAQLQFEMMRRFALRRSSVNAIQSICENISRKLKPSDCAANPTQLLKTYTELAGKDGQGRRYHETAMRLFWKGPPHRSISVDEIEKAQHFMAMLTAGEALRTQGAIANIKELFESDSPDVRLWAGTQFFDIDRETAAAAIHSIFTPASTRQMLELRRIARETPPNQPPLKEMSDDGLIDCFECTACREEAAQFLDPSEEPQDQETANQIAGEMCDILQEVKARGLLSKLEPLLSNPVMTVRWRAAQGCLRTNEKEAVAALKYVVANGRFDEALPARETLDGWRDGKCLVDAL